MTAMQLLHYALRHEKAVGAKVGGNSCLTPLLNSKESSNMCHWCLLPVGSLTWASRPAAAAAVLALNLASPKSMILNSICGPSGAREPSALTLKPGRSAPAAARALAASSGDRSSHSLWSVCKK